MEENRAPRNAATRIYRNMLRIVAEGVRLRVNA
jgi:hypothetical protein